MNHHDHPSGSQLRKKPEANRYDRLEWAGAFGDLGTLIPFIVGYMATLRVDPTALLFAFGASMVATGMYYKTPIPIQPMKVAGAVAITQAGESAHITSAVIHAAALSTGIIWLVLGLTGAISWLTKIVPRPVVVGMILGLGFSFMMQGTKMMADNWLVAGVALTTTLALLSNRRVPPMFLLLVLGGSVGLVQCPACIKELASVSLSPRFPSFALDKLSWQDWLLGILVLTLPQLPLTAGNAIIITVEQNNRLFPSHPITERAICTSTGILNLFSSSVGGVPMCHGAGGLAGHVRFGARTGGALVILGAILLCLSLFLSDSTLVLLKFFPHSVLGVILFLTGAQIALGSCDFGKNKEDTFISLITAGFAVTNVGLALLAGVFCHLLNKRGYLKL